MSPLRRASKHGAKSDDETPENSGTVATATAPASAEGTPAIPAQYDGPTRLGDLLVESNYTTKAVVDAAAEIQASTGRKIGAELVATGAITDEQLAKALASHLGLPLVDLGGETPQPEAIALIPESVARQKVVLPLVITEDGTLRVVAGDPDRDLAKQLATELGTPVALGIAPRDQVETALNRTYRALDGLDTHIEAFSTTVRARPMVQALVTEADGDSPVIAIVERVITQALRDRASDVHIEPQDKLIRIRYRIDGSLHDVLTLPAEMGPGLVSRLKILAGMNIVERRRPQDGQISTRIDGRDIDLRVATVATIWGEACVLRILDKNRSLLRLGDLGMPEDSHEKFAHMSQSPFGMVLCAGPTGSGKTTTLYATLAELNEPHRNIMTVEDPVEYVLPSINQIQMNEAAGISFATGLKSILRQDPDVILVGEIRDVETARIAVQSALTGHFVLSSLHATDAVSALHRFLDMGIESFLIASSVLGVVGQRLVRRMCTHCRQPYAPNEDELTFWQEAGMPHKDTFYKGIGCNFCSNTGYLERIGVYELLKVTPEIKRLVVGWATQDELRRLAVSQGMRTLQDEALTLVNNDVTTISEVMRAIYTF